MQILQHDETETGPRVRKSLKDKAGIECIEVRKIGGLLTRQLTQPDVTLWSYVRPSNGQTLWLIEAELFCPPDAVVYRSYVVDEEPTNDQIKSIVAEDYQQGTII